ncbi:single-strand DNA-binding protein [Nitratiruptor phage NrS-5]|uniref:single-stranded DNA-binding protein n=1 Tax=unclassified Nitratiruptor TaxID=2624044 RepID=UPI001915CC1B|nr:MULTISPECIES: single-stranded DNA-binding protein [unclassified Nitratiruptor]BCD61717.1 single-strand DNA-binding protein [Nitratiruptor sp. YY08-13]BCD65652.1 single-strand DNA-binding protein [Nitratiruptor sp. YY08-26]BCD83195.1 single-strand DNA-binding protein [Nitratiruptor phage NrS-4]BCD83254.1 single-strand DNA-binding protein [Nitratiruptor phage NrS-5]
MSFNKIILLGNIVREIELRYTPSGTAVAKTAIATNRRYKTQSGEQKEEVCFIDITFFGRSAEVANQYLGKGKQVLIEGRLVQEQWTDKNGQKRSKHSVQVESMQMLGSSNGQANKSHKNEVESQKDDQKSSNSQANIPEVGIDDDEIPF